MTKLGYFLLLLAFAFRLEQWGRARETALGLCSAFLLARVSHRISDVIFTGSLSPTPSGVWRLEGAEPSRGSLFSGEILIGREVAGLGPLFGRRVSVSGPFTCALAPRNPGRMEDGIFAHRAPRFQAFGKHFRVVALAEPAVLLSRIPLWFGTFLDTRFAGTPGLRALERTIWLGDARDLPEGLRAFYREGGLLHLLAMSGQRVIGLTFVLGFWATLLLRLCPRAEPIYRHVRRVLPLLSAAVLYVTSNGAAPSVRTLAMAGALLFVRLRRWHCSRLQAMGSAVACAIWVDPTLLSQLGFLLSVGATAILLQVVSETGMRTRVAGYLTLSLALPVLLFPLSAFFFAKVALLAPLHCLALGWLWELVLIPVGLSAPFFVGLLPGAVLRCAESGWQWLLHAQQAWGARLGTAYISTVRPTWQELLLIETVFLAILFAGRRRIICFLLK